jgi:amino acid adenylation domain-containing protein
MIMQDIEDAYGLSATQKGMLFHAVYSPRSGVYVQQMIGNLHEPLNIAAFRRAWQQITNRHAVLRTSFSFERRDEPLQQVHQHVVLPFEEQDWRGLSDSEQERRLKDYLAADRRVGFDLAKAPLMRLVLFHLGEADYRLVWTSHHAILDGRSRLVVLEELFALYEACCRGENAPLASTPLFRAHIDWLTKQGFSHAESFWRRELRGVNSPTSLGIDSRGMKGPDGDERYGSQTLRLSRSLTLSLNRLVEGHQLTLNTLLQGAWALLLSRYSGEREVIFGATRVCRHSPVEGADSMVGVLINTVPVRVNVSEERGLLPWLEELRAKWIGIREHEQTPLSKIQEWSEVPGSTPLFGSLLVFENFELNAALRARARGFEQREFQLIGKTNYPLTISGHRDQQLLVKVDYDRNRFQDDSIARLLGHVETVLGAMVSNPGQRLADISILTETERQRILVEWNDTGKEYHRDKCIHELFEQQVERTPTSVAVVYEDRQLTYRQLNERGNQLAHYLRKRGIGPDCLVGICMERSPDLVVAMLGILKTGGAYVPLDPSYPRERLDFMVTDTRMRVLVSDKRLEELPGRKAEVVCPSSDWEMITRERSQNLSSSAQPDNLAYVIYTSGSTGQPKGVAIPHRAVSRLVCNTNYAQLGPSDRVAQVSNCSFDAATFEIWGALLRGACLIGVAKEVFLSARHFATEIRDKKIGTLFLTTSLFNQLASEIPQAFKTVTHLLFGGEAADPRWVKEILSQGATCRLVHVYGPTESTTFASWHLTQQVQAGAVTIPIGRPISNTQIYLLDARLRPVPLGVTGQLYIGGDGLARCYLNRSELTADSFIPHPFSTEPGARLYRTGDLARYLPDGNIEFLGRADHQVKIRGFRIELGEIEAALRQHPSVCQAVVLADDGPSGTKNLTAYIVAQESEPLLPSQLRDFLKEKLPDYMVPTNLVLLDSLPLTPNGKLDRNRLLTLRHGSTQSDSHNALATPRNHTEETLVRIWRRVLGKERIGIYDNFFELGGNSLLAMEVISNVWRALGVDLPMRQFFDAPTVAGLAENINKHESKSGQLPRVPLRASPRNQDIPLSPRQEFLWNDKDTFVDKPVFNICRVLRLRGALQKNALQRAFNDLIARHESLRTSFSLSPSGELIQVIHLEKEVTLPLVDLSNLARPDREKKARSLAEEEGLIVFRLSESPLLRLKLIRLSQDKHWLVLAISHFAADGWSMKVLFRELAMIYTAYCRNERPDLPPLSIQFADYVLWQRQYLRSEREKLVSYWKQQLGGDLSGLKLPFDYPRPKTPTLRARRETVFLPASLRDSLSQLGRQHQTTVSMGLLAAFKTLLYLYTGQVDIVTGASDANRSDIETTNVIGLFTSITLFRSNLSGNPTFLELLNRVRNVVLDSYQYRGLSMELLEPECQRDNSNGDPMYQCRFLEAPDSGLELSMGELEVKFLPREQCLMRSDLRVFVGHNDKGIEMRWDYSADLFKPETIHLMVQRYHSLLEHIVFSPNNRLSDFSLDSLDKRQQMLSCEHSSK